MVYQSNTPKEDAEMSYKNEMTPKEKTNRAEIRVGELLNLCLNHKSCRYKNLGKIRKVRDIFLKEQDKICQDIIKEYVEERYVEEAIKELKQKWVK